MLGSDWEGVSGPEGSGEHETFAANSSLASIGLHVFSPLYPRSEGGSHDQSQSRHVRTALSTARLVTLAAAHTVSRDLRSTQARGMGFPFLQVSSARYLRMFYSKVRREKALSKTYPIEPPDHLRHGGFRPKHAAEAPSTFKRPLPHPKPRGKRKLGAHSKQLMAARTSSVL